MAYNALILEDNSIQLKALSTLISTNKNDIVPHAVSSYDEAETLLNSNARFNLFMIDINLGNEASQTGLDLALKIRSIKNYKHTPIIFITGLGHHMQSAINDIHCSSYLLKPYTEQELETAIQDALETPSIHMAYTFFKDINNINYKLFIPYIKYIKIEGHYQYVYSSGSSSITLFNRSLTKLTSSLGASFIRCHRNYIINIEHIKAIDYVNKIIIIDTETIPIGRTYEKRIKNFLDEQLYIFN